jgi:hypothetical protein
MSSPPVRLLDMTDIASALSKVDKAHQAGPDEVRGLIVSSPVMPKVVDGPLESPPLTAPAPPAAVPSQKHGSDD